MGCPQFSRADLYLQRVFAALPTDLVATRLTHVWDLKILKYCNGMVDAGVAALKNAALAASAGFR
jgi:hypothetical protein